MLILMSLDGITAGCRLSEFNLRPFREEVRLYIILHSCMLSKTVVLYPILSVEGYLRQDHNSRRPFNICYLEVILNLNFATRTKGCLALEIEISPSGRFCTVAYKRRYFILMLAPSNTGAPRKASNSKLACTQQAGTAAGAGTLSISFSHTKQQSQPHQFEYLPPSAITALVYTNLL